MCVEQEAQTEQLTKQFYSNAKL